MATTFEKLISLVAYDNALTELLSVRFKKKSFLQFFKRFRMFFCWNIGFVVLRICRLIYLIGIP